MMFMKLILYTGKTCPNCPAARAIVREVVKELGLVEGMDFIEKLIDGRDLKAGSIELDGRGFNAVTSEKDIAEKAPAILVGEDFSIEALMHQVASTPAIVINGEAVFVGYAPKKEELLKAIKERL